MFMGIYPALQTKLDGSLHAFSRLAEIRTCCEFSTKKIYLVCRRTGTAMPSSVKLVADCNFGCEHTLQMAV